MALSPSSVRLLVFYLLLPGALGRECTSEGFTKYFFFSNFYNRAKNILLKSFIFSETCTADCPKFQEDRQKLGELRSMNSVILTGVKVKWIIMYSECDSGWWSEFMIVRQPHSSYSYICRKSPKKIKWVQGTQGFPFGPNLQGLWSGWQRGESLLR